MVPYNNIKVGDTVFYTKSYGNVFASDEAATVVAIRKLDSKKIALLDDRTWHHLEELESLSEED